jgi:hypothetical protein
VSIFFARGGDVSAEFFSAIGVSAAAVFVGMDTDLLSFINLATTCPDETLLSFFCAELN